MTEYANGRQRFIAFALWAREQSSLTAGDIAREWALDRATSYRWLRDYRAITGTPKREAAPRVARHAQRSTTRRPRCVQSHPWNRRLYPADIARTRAPQPE